jgi:hypothetical protein
VSEVSSPFAFPMTDQTTEELARYGISIGFEGGRAVELIGRNGISCSYSARGFCPVIGLGAPEGAVYVRMRPDGVAELRVNSRVFEYRKNDPARQMSVAKEDLDTLIGNPIARKAPFPLKKS